MNNSASQIEVQASNPVPGGEAVAYTPESVKHLVVCVAHMLDHFADKEHEGLQEPHNKRRRVDNTGVLIYPNAGQHPNLVGYQLFVANPVENIVNEGRSSVVGVIFDLRAFEQMGDRYLFNMLNQLTKSVRDGHRPSEARLKELSTRYALEH